MKIRPTLFIIALATILAIAFFVSIPRLAPPPSPTIIPSPTPGTFQFNSSTNLRQELDSINPQVLDSDFE